MDKDSDGDDDHDDDNYDNSDDDNETPTRGHTHRLGAHTQLAAGAPL